MPSKYGFGDTRKKNAPTYMKSSGFKMKGSAFLKDVKLYEGNGNQITVDDSKLSEVYTDESGREVRDYSWTTKEGEETSDVMYLKDPKF